MKKEQSLVYPSLIQAILLLVLFVLLMLVITAIQRVLLGESNGTSLFKLCRTLVAMSIVVVYLINKRGIKLLTFPFKKVDTKVCLWMFPIGFLFFFFMWGMIALFILFLGSDFEAPTSVRSVCIYTFISIVCITPLFEELLFRGIILNGFLQRYSLFKAMFLSVILFALLHVGLQILTATFLGILTGYIYYVTKSLWPGIILHGMNNFCAFLCLYLTNNIISGISSDMFQSTEKIVFTIGVLWVIIAIVFLSILYHFLLLLKSKYNVVI